MKILNYKEPNFYTDLQLLLNSRSQNYNEAIDIEVKDIIHEVKIKGDEALFSFSKKFDGVELNKSKVKSAFVEISPSGYLFMLQPRTLRGRWRANRQSASGLWTRPLRERLPSTF